MYFNRIRYEHLKIGGQIINTVKYADDLVLLAKEEIVLQDMTDKLIEIGRYYGMKMNVGKTIVMRISRQSYPVKLTIDQQQLENILKHFKYLGSMLQMVDDVLVKLNPKLLCQKLHLTREGLFFTNKIDLEIQIKLALQRPATLIRKVLKYDLSPNSFAFFQEMWYRQFPRWNKLHSVACPKLHYFTIITKTEISGAY
jgi:hypothetical protein